MSKDYYQILGISKTASKDEIKRAFHKLAHAHHPDKKGGDEKKFKEANEAYQVLSDDEKRAQYDQFGSAGPQQGGFGGGQGFGGFDFSGFQNGQGGMKFDFGDVDLGDIFSMFTGGGFQRVRRGRDLRMAITITFKESIFGVEKEITVPDIAHPSDKKKERHARIQIPAGISAGEQMRVRGYGEQISDGEPGSLYLDILVTPDSLIKREGPHLVMDLDVKLTDAISGAKIMIETLEGETELKIPEGLLSGEILRIKGKGIPTGRGRGDLLVRTHIKIPKKLSRKAREAVEALKEEGI